MEKYRKFEDPQHGVNPFVPDKISPRTGIINFFYYLQILTALIKLPLFIVLYVNFICAHILKYMLIVPLVVRSCEIMINKFFATIFLALLGVYRFTYKFKKWNEKNPPKIIISNQSSIIEWLSLMYFYSPKFLWLAKSQDGSNDYLYELNCYQVFFYGVGLKFINADKIKYTPFNLESYFKVGNTTPVVIFPEATKTNKKGALSVKSKAMNDVYTLLWDYPKYGVRVDNFTFKFNYFSPYNTVESSGLKKLFYTLAQIYNNIEIYSQDLNSINFDKTIDFDKNKFKNINEFLDSQIQSYIVQPEHRYSLSLNCFNHIDFLEYFHSTANDVSYVKKNE